MTDDATLGARIDAIEEAYEFTLAYAAQGRDSDDATPGVRGLRDLLADAVAAMEGIADAAAAEAVARGAGPDDHRDFFDVLADDAVKARAAIRLILGQPAISSQMIENLNNSVHVRALLTDLFLIDEGLKPRAG